MKKVLICLWCLFLQFFAFITDVESFTIKVILSNVIVYKCGTYLPFILIYRVTQKNATHENINKMHALFGIASIFGTHTVHALPDMSTQFQ